MKQFETLYKGNKIAKVGTIIVCPICGEKFTKRQYSQAFCCSACKDKYWSKKGDRHISGYYSRYNQSHPERLERGFTKGYIHGNFSEGHDIKQYKHDFGNLYYDSLGRAYSRDFYNPTLTDMINMKEYSTWHDDDWCESSWGD
jgi:hypothetical protein